MRLLEYIVLLVVWAGLLMGALALHNVSALNLHSICGVWGCGPPTNALIAIHLSWAVAIFPPVLYVPWRFAWSAFVVKRIRLVLVSIGIAGLVAIVLWQWVSWFPQVSELQKSYIWRRCGFAIVTAVDWPFLQLLLVGGLLGLSPVSGKSKRVDVVVEPIAEAV